MDAVMPETKEKENKTDKLLETAKKRLKKCVDADDHNRKEAIEDLRFRNGEQWPDHLKTERQADGRPILSVNMLPKFIKQVVGDQRQNRPRIKIRQVDSKGDVEIAKIYEGVTRNIEYLSRADAIYDIAFESAVSCGYGAWRIKTGYADDDSFLQEISLELIKNPFSVYIDPDCKCPVGSDANFAFVTRKMSREEFEDEYPDAEGGDVKEGEGNRDNLWYEQDSITVAEYYVKEFTKKTLVQLSDGTVLEKKEATAEKLASMAKDIPQPDGTVIKGEVPTIVKEREVKSYEIKQYLITGNEILEGPKKWPGKFIPIVPVMGEELNIEGKRYIRGLIRFAKDPQRMLNYWRTIGAETIALAPKTPYIGTAEQFEGYENDWRDANRKNFAFLKYNSDPKAPGPPARNQAAQIPTGIFTEAQTAERDLENTTGIFKAALGQASNEKSGKAIIARQKESDVANFSYIDNLSRSIAHTGRIIVDLIPKIYDTERDVRIRNFDDTESFAPINTTVNKALDAVQANPQRYSGMNLQKLASKRVPGQDSPFNDISVGKYDVVVEVGPSYSTQRVEAADNMLKLVQAVPEIGKVASDLIVKNMDFTEAAELAERLKKTLPPGLAKPTEGEQPPPPPPPSPEMLLEQEKLKVEQAKLQVEMAKVQKEKMATEEGVRAVVLKVMQEIHAPMPARQMPDRMPMRGGM